MQAAANAAGVHYVDFEEVLEEGDGTAHRICDEDPWVNGFRIGFNTSSPRWYHFVPKVGPGLYVGESLIAKESFHPNALGHEQMAQGVSGSASLRPHDSIKPTPGHERVHGAASAQRIRSA